MMVSLALLAPSVLPTVPTSNDHVVAVSEAASVPWYILTWAVNIARPRQSLLLSSVTVADEAPLSTVTQEVFSMLLSPLPSLGISPLASTVAVILALGSAAVTAKLTPSVVLLVVPSTKFSTPASVLLSTLTPSSSTCSNPCPSAAPSPTASMFIVATPSAKFKRPESSNVMS